MVSSVWGHKIAVLRTKKSRRFRRLLKLITGRRQTEWTGATRCPNEDSPSHKGESLILRKRAVFFRDYLPCRPLAEFFGLTRPLHESVARMERSEIRDRARNWMEP